MKTYSHWRLGPLGLGVHLEGLRQWKETRCGDGCWGLYAPHIPYPASAQTAAIFGGVPIRICVSPPRTPGRKSAPARIRRTSKRLRRQALAALKLESTFALIQPQYVR